MESMEMVSMDTSMQSESSNEASPLRLCNESIIDMTSSLTPPLKRLHTYSMDDDLSAEKTRMLDTPDQASPDQSFHFTHFHKAVSKESPFKRGVDLRVQIPNQMHLRKGAVVVSPHANIFMDDQQFPQSANSQKPDSELILHTCADFAMEYEDACHTPVGDGKETFPDPLEISVKRQATRKRSNSLYSRKDYTPMLKRASSMLQYDNHYQCVELLGKGQFGEVWSARHYRTKEMFALKRSTRTFRGSRDRDTFIREISSMSSIKAHRNVISYERAWQDGGYFYIVMELCQGGNLAKVLESLDCPMSTRRVFSLASGFLAGLEHIHGYKFMHLDLKPDNLFLCDEVGIKIGDFGLCIREDEWEDQEGDRRYLAPEILNSQATCKSDVFSAGLIIFQMLKNLKDLPGNGNDWHLLRQNFSFSASDPGQDGLAQIVGEMIKMDPERRLSSSDALARILSWGSTLTL